MPNTRKTNANTSTREDDADDERRDEKQATENRLIAEKMRHGIRRTTRATVSSQCNPGPIPGEDLVTRGSFVMPTTNKKDAEQLEVTPTCVQVVLQHVYSVLQTCVQLIR